MQEKISVYGYEFEAKLFYSLINDTHFLLQIADVLKPNYFNNEAAQWLVNICINYYKEYNKAPTLLVFKTEISKLEASQKLLKTEALAYLKNACMYSESNDLLFVKENALGFCKNQEIKHAILESVDLLKTSSYDKIKDKLDQALKVGLGRDIGHDYLLDFDSRYMEDSRKAIPTPWEVINSITNGGLSFGELGVIVAPMGAGKSWVLTALGAHAVSLGYNVIHYTLELNNKYSALRYDSILSGINSNNLLMHKDKIKKIVDGLPGKLIVEEYPTKGANILNIKAHLDRCIALDIKPDVIIVDYADLLKGSNKELRHELREIYEGLRNIAGEYSSALWTASQSNRTGISEEIIQATEIAEDISKVATADLVISVSRKMEDKLANTARFHIIKNRFGQDGQTYPSKFDASNGNIDIYSTTSSEATQVRKEMEIGSDLKRRKLGEKYFDLLNEI